MQPAREATDIGPVAHEWPQVPASVRQARHLLRGTLCGWDFGLLIDDAELVLAELLSNAILHPRTPGLTVKTNFSMLGASAVRLEVCDADNLRLPRLRPSMPSDPRGRGLQLVDDLSHGRWGYEWRSDGPGKLVWAHIGTLRPI